MVLDELRRGAVRLHILRHAAEGEIHGAWIALELARHGHHISPGTLYPALHRLEDEGLLTSTYRVVDGKRRRLYRATVKGRRELAAAKRMLAELAEEILDGRRRTATHRRVVSVS